MNGVSSKVAVGTGIAGLSTGPSVVVVWLLGLWFNKHGISIPPEIATAIGNSVSTAFGFLAGYIATEVQSSWSPDQLAALRAFMENSANAGPVVAATAPPLHAAAAAAAPGVPQP